MERGAQEGGAGCSWGSRDRSKPVAFAVLCGQEGRSWERDSRAPERARGRTLGCYHLRLAGKTRRLAFLFPASSRHGPTHGISLGSALWPPCLNIFGFPLACFFPAGASVLQFLTPSQPLGWSLVHHELPASSLISFGESRFCLRSLPAAEIIVTLPLLRQVTAVQETNANSRHAHDTSGPLCLTSAPLYPAGPLFSAPPPRCLTPSTPRTTRTPVPHALPHKPSSTDFPKWRQHLPWTPRSPLPLIPHPLPKSTNSHSLASTAVTRICPPIGFLPLAALTVTS